MILEDPCAIPSDGSPSAGDGGRIREDVHPIVQAGGPIRGARRAVVANGAPIPAAASARINTAHINFAGVAAPLQVDAPP
jgi:hypothetical protein